MNANSNVNLADKLCRRKKSQSKELKMILKILVSDVSEFVSSELDFLETLF